jgi:hypothetical protein
MDEYFVQIDILIYLMYMIIGSLSVCAVTMQSELQCWGTGLHDVERRPMDIEIA